MVLIADCGRHGERVGMESGEKFAEDGVGEWWASHLFNSLFSYCLSLSIVDQWSILNLCKSIVDQ